MIVVASCDIMGAGSLAVRASTGSSSATSASNVGCSSTTSSATISSTAVSATASVTGTASSRSRVDGELRTPTLGDGLGRVSAPGQRSTEGSCSTTSAQIGASSATAGSPAGRPGEAPDRRVEGRGGVARPARPRASTSATGCPTCGGAATAVTSPNRSVDAYVHGEGPGPPARASNRRRPPRRRRRTGRLVATSSTTGVPRRRLEQRSLRCDLLDAGAVDRGGTGAARPAPERPARGRRRGDSAASSAERRRHGRCRDRSRRLGLGSAPSAGTRPRGPCGGCRRGPRRSAPGRGRRAAGRRWPPRGGTPTRPGSRARPPRWAPRPRGP